MKKFLINLIVLGLFLFNGTRTNAQLQKGNILVGSDIADVNLGLDKGGNFSFLINPKAGWFIKDNIALGPEIVVGLSTATGAGTSVNYGIGAFGRYYFSKEDTVLVRHSRFFLEGNAGINGDNPAVGDNTNGLGIGVGPGWTYFVTSNIGLEALFKYNGIIGFGSSATSNNLNLSVGFQIYMPSSKVKETLPEPKY